MLSIFQQWYQPPRIYMQPLQCPGFELDVLLRLGRSFRRRARWVLLPELGPRPGDRIVAHIPFKFPF